MRPIHQRPANDFGLKDRKPPTIHLRFCVAAFCGLLVIAGRAQALVGGAPIAIDGLARAVVGIVGPGEKFCTATAVARDLLLTAAHCVQPSGNQKVQYRDPKGKPQFLSVAEVQRHPQFNVQPTRVVADLALVKLASSLPVGVEVAELGMQHRPIWPGDQFTVIGGGVSVRGNHQTGFNRIATLVAAGPYSSVQVRLVDPSGKVGACYGDSGAPVFRTVDNHAQLIAVVSWAGSLSRRRGCGEQTGATLLSPYREWILDTMGKLGAGPVH